MHSDYLNLTDESTLQLKIDTQHAEIKIMRTREKFLRQSVGQFVLKHIIKYAIEKGKFLCSIGFQKFSIQSPMKQ
jgi:hypothetical protein